MLHVSNKRTIPYIVHSQITPILESFKSAVWAGDVATVSGLRGTGKMALLKYFKIWLAQQPGSFSSDQVVVLRLKPSLRQTLSHTDALSPMTVITYSLLWHELCKLGVPSYLEKPEGDGGVNIYSEKEFHRLLPKLEALLRTRQICAIGIHGAELLDDLTMEWLKDLHDSCGQQFAFLLARLYPFEQGGTAS